MNAQTASLQPRRGRNLKTELTRCPEKVKAAQRLRYQVFSEEYGSDLGATTPGIDADGYDDVCEHLTVTDADTGELVATTRILHQDDHGAVGGFYSSGEFNLSALDQLPGTVAELGRTCVHPDYRNGGTITLLWAAIAEYLTERQVDYLIGCASIALGEGYNVAAIDQHIRENHRAPAQYRVSPRYRLESLPGDPLENGKRMPPLLKAYLRMGAKVCGEPCWDPDFNCLDYFILLAVDDLPSRYVQHFLQPAQAV